jgi:hypothetical protein
MDALPARPIRGPPVRGSPRQTVSAEPRTSQSMRTGPWRPRALQPNDAPGSARGCVVERSQMNKREEFFEQVRRERVLAIVRSKGDLAQSVRALWEGASAWSRSHSPRETLLTRSSAWRASVRSEQEPFSVAPMLLALARRVNGLEQKPRFAAHPGQFIDEGDNACDGHLAAGASSSSMVNRPVDRTWSSCRNS